MVLGVLLGRSEVLQVGAIVPVAQFVFGDSLVDQGNNNNLNSLAKANFKPHGIDLAEFDYQSTGRFCNGRLVSDFISEYMGTPSVLAYPDASGEDLLRGVNFASAGSGILDDSGAIFGERTTLNQQITNFEDVKTRIESQLGQVAANQLFSKAIFAFTTGANDFMNNYLLPLSPRSAQYPIDEFIDLVVSTFEGQLKQVYNLGARKLSVANVGPAGCIPYQLQSGSSDGSCVEKTNQVVIAFNKKLKPMVENLSAQLPGSIVTYSDSYSMVIDLVLNPDKYGFEVVNEACCGIGRFNGLIPCNVLNEPCKDRSKYLFWDTFHPSEKANYIVVQKLLYGPPANISPMNLSQLIPL